MHAMKYLGIYTVYRRNTSARTYEKNNSALDKGMVDILEKKQIAQLYDTTRLMLWQCHVSKHSP